MFMKRLVLLVCAFLVMASFARADDLIYANLYGSTEHLLQIDLTTGGNVLNNYIPPLTQNGRGVVVVGNTMYFTTANSNHVYTYDLSTNTFTGTAFSVAGSSALSTMAYDGTDFWIGDYSGTNHAYLYSPSGTLIKTISLADCTGYCDGLEYVALNGGELVSNETDGFVSNTHYDIYDLNGNLLQHNFITPQCTKPGSSGIAFDGTNFFTSCINDGTLEEWTQSGTFVKTLAVTPNPQTTLGEGIEDLSANYSVVLPPTTTPEPSAVLLLGTGLFGLAWVARRRHAVQRS